MADLDAPDTRTLAARLRTSGSGRTFGAIRFWRFAVVRPHDQCWRLVDAQAEADRLDLHLMPDGPPGPALVLSIWQPRHLVLDAGGLQVQQAQQLRFADSEAWLHGTDYRLRTPRGEGMFPIQDTPALTLET